MDRSPLAAQLGYEGRALLQAYRQTGEKDYLNESISLARQALENALPLERAIYLNDLGNRLRERFGACRNLNDISEAIELVELSSQTISDCSLRAIVLNNLGTFLSDRFEWSQDPGDLERGIRAANHALDLSSADVSFQAQCKNTLCLLYGYCYTKSGNVEDLETATRMAHEAVEMTNENDESLAMFMGNLGICYERRFERLGYSADIDKAIYYARRTVEFITSSDDATDDTDNATERSLYLKNLSNALGQRFAVSDCLQDIEDAIEYGIDAANLIAGFPQWPEILHNVSLLLENRFMRLGDITDLDEAIELENKAASAISAEDPRSLTHWDQLGYLKSGLMGHFESVAALIHEAMMTDVLHGRRFVERYTFTKNEDDIQRSIQFAQKAVGLVPAGHPWAPYCLLHSSLALETRYRAQGSASDLEEAIKISQDALAATSLNRLDRVEILYSLSMQLTHRYEQLGALVDLEEAIHLMQESKENMPKNIAYGRAMCLKTLNNNMSTLTEAIDVANEAILNSLGLLEDLEAAIDVQRKALQIVPRENPERSIALYNLKPRHLVEATSIGHPNRAMYLNSVGMLLQEYPYDIDMFTEALRHENSPPLDRIKAGQNAFHSCIVDGEWSAANSVARDVVKLFPLLQHLLKNISRFTSLAASAVLQILEAGRGAEISALEELEPALYQEYTQLRRQILLPTVSSLSKATGPGQSLFTRKGRRKSRSNPPRLITAGFEHRIRSVPGFEHFLERHSEQDHISLAKSGPIVAFNVTEHRSDAIIITNIKITNVRAHIPKVIGESQLSKELQNILQWLWDTAVLPVLTELNLYTRDGRSETALPRIWWMSTGNGEGATAMDYVLKFSQTRHNQRLLDNSDPDVKMLQDLDIEAEIQSIKEDRPCREDVLKELPSSHILHFSCHGKSNATDPSDSALVLAQTATNEQYSLLTVKDLTEINHDKAQLAYLSACSTAENSSDNLLDEVIHIASTFQLIGFPHVVGTLWKIGDRAAVAVSRLFYDELGRRVATGEDLNKSIAYALHGALQKHRSTKRVARGNDVLSWAPFIYMGA
ncbi:CHAT domain-containing protein [Aspergillus multicolor]|uniref:CHAT domain-containing protein n=1 Tax=Aspergillus multicolor TaxID=41759 RepID=UPI003CCD7E2D